MCRLALIALACLIFASQAQAKLKVFILAGQSNMQGAGAIKINPKSKNGGQGTLEYLVKEKRLATRLAHVVDANGDWVVRDDVWIKYFDRKGGLMSPPLRSKYLIHTSSRTTQSPLASTTWAKRVAKRFSFTRYSSVPCPPFLLFGFILIAPAPCMLDCPARINTFSLACAWLAKIKQASAISARRHMVR